MGADLGRPLTLHLVRHARTADTGSVPSGGDADGPPLSERGLAEARALGAALASAMSAGTSATARGPGSGTPNHPPTATATTPAAAGTRGAATGPVAAATGPGPVTPDGSRAVSSLDPALGPSGADPSALPRAAAPSSPDLLLLSSPLLRTRQTAQILGSALGLEVGLAQEWAELRLGEWNGLTYRRIAQGWPDEYARWQDSPAARPPGGESVEDLRTRVEAALDRLRTTQAGKSVVLVTHTGPIRAAVASALEAGPAAFWRLRTDPASVTTLRFWADGGVEVVGVNRRAGADWPGL